MSLALVSNNRDFDTAPRLRHASRLLRKTLHVMACSGMSYETIAEKTKGSIVKSTLYAWDAGKTKDPSIGRISAVLHVCGATLDVVED